MKTYSSPYERFRICKFKYATTFIVKTNWLSHVDVLFEFTVEKCRLDIKLLDLNFPFRNKSKNCSQ